MKGRPHGRELLIADHETRSIGRTPDAADPERVNAYKLPSPVVVHEALRSDGEELLNRPWNAWVWSALGGGLTMGLSVVTAAGLHAAVGGAAWGSAVVALAASFGYLVIILGRQGLITETAMVTALEVLSRPELDKIRRFAMLIALVSGANVIGALLFTALLAGTSVLDPHYHHALIELGSRTLEPPASTLFVRAFLGGWAIALAVWTAPAAGSAKVLMIVVLAYITGLLHLSHLAVGSIEVMAVAFQDGSAWAAYLFKFLPAVLTGNLLGAFGMVALLNHLQVRTERRRLLGQGA